MSLGYDEKCFELARYFMPKASNEAVGRLAQVIQDAIEQELEPHNHFCQQCGKVLKEECECDNANRMDWCSANCRAAFDL